MSSATASRLRENAPHRLPAVRRPNFFNAYREPRSDARIRMSFSQWAKVAAGVVGVTLASFSPSLSPRSLRADRVEPSAVHAAEAVEVPVQEAGSSISLEALGIKVEEFMSHRELASRKTTQYSEAEEEIMELEEDEIEFQYFYNLQAMWAALASIGGIAILYKGGVLWENWIKEQERKDMEEEIELTGTFIDPRAVRKEESEEEDQKKDKKKNKTNGDEQDDEPRNKKKGPEDPGSGDDSPSDDKDLPPDGIDALERLFGRS